MESGQFLIAEVKTTSPSGWESEKSWEELFEIAAQYGSWLAIHTDARWGGSFELLEKARGLTDKPLLAKGIHDNDELVDRAFDSGASYALVVGRIPKTHLNQCLIEPRSLYELRLLERDTPAVWNARDLNNLESDQLKTNIITGEPISFKQARQVRPKGWMCQASGIVTCEDVDPTASAVLVGRHLPEFVKTLG